MVAGSLVFAQTASAATLAATGTSVTTVALDTTTTLPGMALSGAQSGDILQVNLSTDVGSLNLPTTTGLTLAYGYTAYSGATLSFTGSQADINADLASLQLLSGNNSGATAHVALTSFVSQANLSFAAPNNHFYEYVPSANITWSNAKTAAAGKTYGGLTGYIATIPNDAVNSFVGSKIQGAQNVWFGARIDATDTSYPRVWKWAAGPLAGQVVSRCAAATGSCSFANGVDGLNGHDYSHWATGEPNNSGSGENSAVTNWNGSVGNWNDLSNNPSNISGYLVEYGNLANGSSTAPTGTASVSSTITVTGPPAAPTPTASINGRTATLSWTTPTNTGNGTISGYTVTASPGGATCIPSPATATTCTITGLTVGQAYTFTATATNQYGTSAAGTASNSVTAVAIPSAPALGTVTRGDSSAQVSFTAPSSNGGSAVIRYEASANGGTTWQTLSTSGTAPITATVTGLTNGTQYPITVRAVTAVGNGDASNAVTVTPATVPAQPFGLTTSRGDGTVTVNWTAPANGGDPITGYSLAGSPGGATCTPSPATATTCTFTGLTPGNAYKFNVTAANSVGTGASSFSTAFVTVVSSPDAPTGLTTTRGDGSAQLTFSPPAGTGGTPITGYEYTTDGGTTWLPLVTTGASTLTATVTGLANGVPATIAVRAKNVVGNSTASSTSTVTPVGAPGAPTQVSTSADGTDVTVSWSAPTDDHGSAVTGYAVTATPGGATCTPQVATDTSCTITGLTKGTAYTFAVTATNAIGTSAAAASAPITPITRPGAPTGLQVTAGDATISVVFTPPGDNGGTAITGYEITTDGGSTWVPLAVSGTTSLSSTLVNQVNGQDHDVAVRAVNLAGAGTSSATTTVTPGGPPSAPTSVSTSADGTDVTVSWVAPVDTHGSPIIGYTVTASSGGGTCTPQPATGTSCTITGLTKGTAYTFSVGAINALGTSSSAVSTPVTPVTVPGAPTGLQVTTGAATIAVAFTPPADNGGTPITGYEITTDGGSTWSPLAVSGTTSLSSTLVNQVNGQGYDVAVRAVNLVGTSSATASQAVTPSTIPDAVSAVTVSTSGTTATVSWSAPAFDGGSPITGHLVVSNPDGLTCTATATQQSCTVTGLTKGTAYTFDVVAANANGAGPIVTSSPVTPLTSPTAPGNLAVTAGDGQALVSFDGSTDDGGTPITGYEASTDGGTTWVPLVTTGSNPTTATIADLTNGSTYPVVVRAVNTFGHSAATAPESVSPVGAPVAVGNVTTALTGTSATISWTAPVSDGGGTVSGYTVDANPGPLQCTPVPATATTCTITGLDKGTSYVFAVRAVNQYGTSVPASSAPATPVTVPDAPTGFDAERANQAVVLTFDAPVDEGGTAITGYEASTDGGTTWLPVTTTGTGPLTATVGGLLNGRSYNTAVRAINTVGHSAPTSVVAAVPATMPDAPTGVTTQRNGASITVSWTAPGDDGGAVLTGYSVAGSPGLVGCSATSATSCVVTGLDPAVAYSFTVKAANFVGDSPATAPVTVPAATAPGAVGPVTTEVAPNGTDLVLNWTAPTDDGGAAVTGYQIVSNPAGLTCTPSPATATTCTITNVPPGVAYTFSVVAVNVTGAGSGTSTANPVTLLGVPTAPRNLVLTPGTGRLGLTFDAPMSDGGSPILGYYVSLNGGATWQDLAVQGSGPLTATVSGLSPDRTYAVRVMAHNANGLGGALRPPVLGTPLALTVPSAPPNLTVTATGYRYLGVTFDRPASDGGSPVLGYHISLNGGSTWQDLPVRGTGPLAGTVTGLTPGQTYMLRVQAYNAVGLGGAVRTPVMTDTDALTVPSAPTGLVVSSSSGKLGVWFHEPISDGGSPILGYRVSLNGGSTWQTLPVRGPGPFTGTVTGLVRGKTYQLRVQAYNAVGLGGAERTPVPGTPS